MTSSGSGVTVGFSFANGLALLTATVLIGWFSQTYNGFSFQTLLWIILPVLSFIFTLALNTGVQSLSCSSINLKQTAMNSIFTPIFVIAFLAISWISAFQSPIIGILPVGLSQNLQEVIAYSFFMFWAGMFGEGLGAGFAQSCGAS